MNRDVQKLVWVTKALADPNRVRALCALRGGERCVCELIELLGLAPSTVSKHLSILHQAELVESRKDGRWVYYRLPEPGTAPAAEQLAEALFQALAGNPVLEADARRLASIREPSRTAPCEKAL